ncbi:MAG: hypothetical protein GX076_06130, partial [Clostridiales bacterium]|nr:hypothetical protein [Clostridiales bacterium]
MSDNYDKRNNNEKEIEEFLKEFDRISYEFEKTDTKIDIEKDSSETEVLKTRTASRLDRLNKSRKRRKRSKETDESDINEKGIAMARKQKKRKRYKFNPKRLLLTLVCIGLIICLGVGIWALSIIKDTPKIDADNIYSMLSENSILYDDHGREIENIYESGRGLRTNLSYTEMPKQLIDAFVAIEDKTFWEHSGFNFVRIIGAIVDAVTSGESIVGTSTITQQLARNLYLEDTRTVRSLERKVKEAYYAIQLERQLSKEEIIEAYLNTIDLGSGANGVQAASQTYFSKDVGDLTLAECALLASIPKSPSKYSPIKKLYNEDVYDPESLDLIYKGETLSIFYQDNFRDRQLLTLKLMLEQGKISDAEYEEAIAQDMRASINPNIDLSTEISSYFADYVVSQVVKDLMFEYNLDESEAKHMIYNGGLRIYSTLNVDIQKKVEAEFSNNQNFPKVTGLNRDKAGNARDSKGNILLYNYSNIFDDNGNFILKPDEYQINEDGSMTIFAGKRLNIYKTEVQNKIDYSLEFKPMYTIEDNIFYSISGGYIRIPAEFKDRDNDGNLIIKKEFFEEKSAFEFTDAGVVIPKEYCQLKEKVIQPQSAMVIIDHSNGAIKAMAGGRSLSGRLLFNRAIGTRQPGSAIKPISVYAPALQSSVDLAMNNAVTPETKLWTAATSIDDAPLVLDGKLWPRNWYAGYRGLHTLRKSVEQSVNVNAVKTFLELGTSTSLSFLKKLGITSVVESGPVNDLNPAALALGGMTNGISPLEMAAAYSAFVNEGLYIEPICYTQVTNKKGEVLLARPKIEQVMDRGVAFIMTDILRTTVTNGIAKSAAIGSHPVAGKTGTTTDNYDAWFVGMSPYYTAALWIGNDINLELSQGSAAAARLWSKVMKQVHSGLPNKSFPPKPDNVISVQVDTISGLLPSELSALDPRGTVRSEYFVKGTEPTKVDDMHVEVTICNSSGYLATPFCFNRETKVMVRRPEGSVLSYGNHVVADINYEAPRYYCNLHNLDPTAYPIDPDVQLDPNFIWNGV